MGNVIHCCVGDAASEFDADWRSEVPTGTDAEAYTVWYRVKGDANHKDTDPAS